MPDYKKMYLTLVDEIIDAIDSLSAALKRAEDIYLDEGWNPSDLPSEDD